MTRQKSNIYEKEQIDPYFAGIDTLLHLPEDRYEHQIGAQFAEFGQKWAYQEGRRKIIWEVTPIPLFSLWRAPQVMGADAQAELDANLAQCTDLQTMNEMLYRYYARAVYGTDIPSPHFYLGANRNGDLKLRSFLPIALLGGGKFRMYYTPYPSLFMKRESFQAIIEDVASSKRLHSTKVDYSGQLPAELVEAEYQRVVELRDDPASTVGLSRRVRANQGESKVKQGTARCVLPNPRHNLAIPILRYFDYYRLGQVHAIICDALILPLT